jgi:hypothetical protein
MSDNDEVVVVATVPRSLSIGAFSTLRSANLWTYEF